MQNTNDENYFNFLIKKLSSNLPPSRRISSACNTIAILPSKDISDYSNHSNIEYIIGSHRYRKQLSKQLSTNYCPCF